jgi:hypothetical protein
MVFFEKEFKKYMAYFDFFIFWSKNDIEIQVFPSIHLSFNGKDKYFYVGWLCFQVAFTFEYILDRDHE